MEKQIVLDAALTRADQVVLRNLARDIEASNGAHVTDDSTDRDSGIGSEETSTDGDGPLDGHDAGKSSKTAQEVARLKALRNPGSGEFEPTVLLSVDDCSQRVSPAVNKHLLQPYVRLAQKVARHQTDVVMITHLIMYFSTLVPSAILLYRRFSLIHGILHSAMQIYYLGSYTLMMHQHIHQRGILAKQFAAFDKLFPYILDPLMGHTWNSYYYHHVKHHHVENNGPDDLSSTLRFQRDSVADFLCYVGRFFFLVWIELPLYFLRKNRLSMAMQAAGCESLTYVFYCAMAILFGGKATFFVYLFPLLLMRTGLMIGNWGQHAFVDADEPDSDFRSSVTLIDVASNRFCFNDGYHTSHHLNPLRHWRDHPISFLEQKQTYAREGAIVFHNIDFLMVSFRLLCKDYHHLAKCMVPMGSQIDLTMEGRVDLLKKLTRKFSEEEILEKFRHRTETKRNA
ncbi:fatty acid desaturase domain-containing protein [Hirsutella rhossiliensis]|uniref:Fatty acid desaturase domain-containing protein n=1 Tax=Hirsutella rhossiliensis TaxID=111463 RepID=A0A9P8MZ61_9HYPO|nr:fatty acid desaturase domain-containing protein [Hirsutella rhossiliensis]KAH0963992.1 fatty acid desaturase domain-containing protein [Hirsutella rhossiliensis]